MIYKITDFYVGQHITFGRDKGQQTLGVVAKVNTKKLKVKQLEARGLSKAHPVGTVWTVPPSLCTPCKVQPRAAAATVPTIAKPPCKPRPAYATGSATATALGLPRCVVGETLRIQGTLYTMVGYKTSRPKYPIAGTGPRGGRYKFSVDQVLTALGSPIVSKAKRPDDDILWDMLAVYNGLIPENLYCDGELTKAQTRRKERDLRAQLRSLSKELGREVSEGKVWNWARIHGSKGAA